ncbi:MAG: FMN-binding negative transcriptional regulator, partial [Xanthomonadaceae bacterium]|nr:FMN-binding negative transcriptional regulator [Xanthomonadaceae bacterium]
MEWACTVQPPPGPAGNRHRRVREESPVYLPPAFREERLEVLHAAVRELAFASLVTHGAEGLDASHVPLHLLLQPAPLG